MKRLSVVILALLVLVSPVNGLDYPTATFIEDDIELHASVSADTPWYSPFSEEADLTLSVVPTDPNVDSVIINEVTLSVHKHNPTGSGFSLVTVDTEQLTPAVTGTSYANFTGSFFLASSTTGIDCYFGVSVQGSYTNSTHTIDYQIVSNESLVGPFTISASFSTPQVLVGFAVTVFATVICIVGLLGVRKSRSVTKRRTLLDE
ncbi:MAG: hypothetical protein RTU92_09650 [Candidatus Thorarchaeota archaeon]